MSSNQIPPELPEPPPPLPPENVVIPPHSLPADHPASTPSPPPGTPSGPYYPNPDERSNGMLIHLLGLVSGFIGPLILWLARKDSSVFLDHQGKEALNFQITIMIVLFGSSIIGTGLSFLTLGIATLLLIPLSIVYLVLILVWEITGCIRANRGEWYTYPMSIRLIR